MKVVLHNKSVVIIGIAESVSGLGSWITAMAIFTLIIFRNGGNVLQSSGIFLAAFLPVMMLSPLAGKLSDRYNRKKLMIASEVLSGVFIACMIFAPDVGLIYVLMALQAAASCLMMPARQGAIPSLVAKENLTKTNAFFQQLAGIIKICGPVVAGFLLALVDPHQAMILDVASFLISALLLSQLPDLIPESDLPQNTKPSIKETSTANLSVVAIVRANPSLALLFVTMFLSIIVIMSFDVFSSIITRDLLQADEGFFGLMIGLVGMGTVLASVGLMLKKGASQLWRDVFVGLLLLDCIPLCIALMGHVGNLSLLRIIFAVGCFVGGIGNGLLLIQINTLLQLQSPPTALGRVSGAFQSTTIAGQLIAVVIAPLIVPALLPIDVFFALGTLIVLSIIGGAVMLLRHAGPNRSRSLTV